MTFYRTPERRSFDANIFEESMIDYGEQVAVRDDLGAIGGMLGYGNIYHNPQSPDLPVNNPMAGRAGSAQGITGFGTSFTTLGCETIRTDRDSWWGIRLTDPGVWFALIKFSAIGNNDTSDSTYWLQTEDGSSITTESSQWVPNGSRTVIEAHKVIVADDPGRLVIPCIVTSNVNWHEGEMSMTVFRIDGNSSQSLSMAMK